MNFNFRNQEEKANRKKIRRNDVFILFIAIIVVLAVFASFKMLYSFITDRLIEISLNNMEELSKHDEKSIVSGIERRWLEIEGIATEIKSSESKNIQDVLKILKLKSQTLRCLETVLVSDTGEIYTNKNTITPDIELLKQNMSSSNKFVYRTSHTISNVSDTIQLLAVGSKVEKFEVAGINIEYIICYYDINTLIDELKIDSFDGQGFSSIINIEGDYIVSVNRESHESNINERDNFYTILSKTNIDDGMTIEKIRKKIENKENFSFEYTSNGATRIVTLSPMDDIDWYFVMTIPRSVIEENSSSFLRIVAVLIIVILFGTVSVVLLSFRNKSQKNLMEVETRHRNELEDALDLAQQANNAKTSFLNSMSHDIRTPMNAIIGFTKLIKDHIDEKEKVLDYQEKITEASGHLLSLINDILDMSRIESGRVNIEENLESLREIMQGIDDIVQADVENKNLDFLIEMINVVDVKVYCDKLRINQILLNLISNAIKFTPDGGKITVTVTEKSISKNGYGKYEFRVKDTGIGMSPEFMKVIFEPFTRERTSTVSGIQGTGLGMSIAKSIVDMMAGTIEVKSKQNEGTEFIVTLELKLDEERGDIPEVENNVELEPQEKFKGKRILLVEDNPMNREISTEYLQDFGFIVESAENRKSCM